MRSVSVYPGAVLRSLIRKSQISKGYGGTSTLSLADLARKHPIERDQLSKHNDSDKNLEAMGRNAAATIDEVKATGDVKALPPSAKWWRSRPVG